MENIINGIKICCGTIAAVLSFVFGGLDVLLKALIACMVVDYITGVCAAVYRKKLNSATGFKGILKKIVIMCIVAAAHFMDIVFGINAIREMAVGFYIANEGISILENAGKMNVPIAKNLASILEQLREKTEKDVEIEK